MLTLRRWPFLAVALIMSLLAAGCGRSSPTVPTESTSSGVNAASGTQSTSSGVNAASGAPGAPGMPGNNGPNGGGGSAKAVGAPLTIPDMEEVGGADPYAVRHTMITGDPLPGETWRWDPGLQAQCGGTLCVTIEITPTPPGAVDRNGFPLSAENETQCNFLDWKPSDAVYKRFTGTVPRGSTILLLTGTQPCTSTSSPGSESSSPGSESSSPGSESSSPGSESSSPGSESPTNASSP
jgi:hypothetical protein